MKPALLIAFLAATSPACAGEGAPAPSNDAVIGDVVSGIQAVVSMDGKISFNVPHERVWLGDGREMRFEDEHWKVIPVNPKAPPVKVSATDFALYAERYIGHIVEVSGGALYRADVNGSYLSLPGRKVIVWFLGTPREDIRTPIELCSEFIPSKKCGFTVIGQVTKRVDNGAIGIRATSLVAPARDDPTSIAPGVEVLSK